MNSPNAYYCILCLKEMSQVKYVWVLTFENISILYFLHVCKYIRLSQKNYLFRIYGLKWTYLLREEMSLQPGFCRQF